MALSVGPELATLLVAAPAETGPRRAGVGKGPDAAAAGTALPGTPPDFAALLAAGEAPLAQPPPAAPAAPYPVPGRKSPAAGQAMPWAAFAAAAEEAEALAGQMQLQPTTTAAQPQALPEAAAPPTAPEPPVEAMPPPEPPTTMPTTMLVPVLPLCVAPPAIMPAPAAPAPRLAARPPATAALPAATEAPALPDERAWADMRQNGTEPPGAGALPSAQADLGSATMGRAPPGVAPLDWVASRQAGPVLANATQVRLLQPDTPQTGTLPADGPRAPPGAPPPAIQAAQAAVPLAPPAPEGLPAAATPAPEPLQQAAMPDVAASPPPAARHVAARPAMAAPVARDNIRTTVADAPPGLPPALAINAAPVAPQDASGQEAAAPMPAAPAAAVPLFATLPHPDGTQPLAAPADALPPLSALQPAPAPLAATRSEALPPAPPPHRPPMSEAAQQVVLQAVTAATDGVESISVDLRPPELGRVELRLTFQDGTVQVTMAAERSDTFQALQQDRAGLEQQMQRAGLQLGGGGLDLQHGRLPRPAPETPAAPRWAATAGESAEEIEAARPLRSDSLIDLIA